MNVFSTLGYPFAMPGLAPTFGSQEDLIALDVYALPGIADVLRVLVGLRNAKVLPVIECSVFQSRSIAVLTAAQSMW